MRRRTIGLCCLLLLPLTMANMAQADCRQSTAPLESMEQQPVRFLDGDDGPVDLTVRLAETSRQRAAGMQHLCERAVRDNPMLFLFRRPV